jgi:hypothetical protein
MTMTKNENTVRGEVEIGQDKIRWYGMVYPDG